MTVNTLLDYDTCLRNLGALANYYSQNVRDRNEATTRLHLIDTVIFECLGWAKHDAYTEEPRDGEYTDYSFFAPRRIMILEAKREGDYFEIPATKTSLTYSIKSLCRGNPGLKQALDQVAGYCQTRGIPVGVFSNGHQLVAFIAVRDDGVAPMDGKCAVFPSLGFMVENFSELWNLLSRIGVEEKRLFSRLLGHEQPKPPEALCFRIGAYPGTKGRNVFQTDLQIISEVVIEDIIASKNLEQRFLQECYCPSGALSQHSLANRSLLTGRYVALFTEQRPGPTPVPAVTRQGITSDFTADCLSQRPILLIGDVGVGKTTFIKRLINVDAADVFSEAISIYIDLGSQATLSSDLRHFVTDEVWRQLERSHNVDIEEEGFVRGVYHSDLARFRKGIYGRLREPHPDEYALKEIEFLEQRMKDRPEHLRASLEHLSKARKKQIVVFLDNADQRADTVQDAAFLIAQELAQHWPTLVYVALRPETFHRSVQSGALSGYHPKAFTISPPRTDRLLENRLEFALKLTQQELPLPFLQKNAVERLSQLRTILQSFLASIKQNEELIECIDNIAGGNMRVVLNLVRGFFGSGHVDVQEIVRNTTPRNPYIVSVHQFLRAAIYGDAVYYDPRRSPVANLFDVSTRDSKEHFVLPVLLGVLRHGVGGQGQQGFVDTGSLYQVMQSVGFTPDQIDFALVRAFRKKLIETPASEVPQVAQAMPRSFRITTIGLYHVDRLPRMFTYVDAMTVVTPIFEEQTMLQVVDDDDIFARLRRCGIFQRYLDRQWKQCQPSEHNGEWAAAFDWDETSCLLSKDIERVTTEAERRRR